MCLRNTSHKTETVNQTTNSATCAHSSLITLHFVPFSTMSANKLAQLLRSVIYTHLVAPVFVKHNQEYGHDNDDTDHDSSVENWIQGSLSYCLCLFRERSVDATTTKSQLKCHWTYRCFLYVRPTSNGIAVIFQFRAIKATALFYLGKIWNNRVSSLSSFNLKTNKFLRTFLDHYYFLLCKTNKKPRTPGCLTHLLTYYEWLGCYCS